MSEERTNCNTPTGYINMFTMFDEFCYGMRPQLEQPHYNTGHGRAYLDSPESEIMLSQVESFYSNGCVATLHGNDEDIFI